MKKTVLSLLAVLAVAGPALAKAPAPSKPVDVDRFLGRWYEAARTPNGNQKNCWGATQEWSRLGPGKYSVVNICRKGSAKGAASTMKGTGTFSDPKGNKVVVAFFGGVVKQEYWILDHADDYRWALVGTPGGNFIWVMSKTPAMTASTRDEALGRARALGYNPKKLEFRGLTPAA